MTYLRAGWLPALPNFSKSWATGRSLESPANPWSVASLAPTIRRVSQTIRRRAKSSTATVRVRHERPRILLALEYARPLESGWEKPYEGVVAGSGVRRSCIHGLALGYGSHGLRPTRDGIGGTKGACRSTACCAARPASGD